MQCTACQSEVTAGANFCSECGAAVARACAQCGARVADDARFCSACGASLAAAVRQAPPAAANDGERRHLTVLFCDVVGSTQLSTALDPEDYRDVVRRYQIAATDVITRFGGHVAQYLGDGILAYFGYPTALEHDAERAVRTGLEIVTAVRGLRGLPSDVRLAVRIGAHTGQVVVADIGTADHAARLALGDTPNVAARVQASAASDAVVISAATEKLVAGLFVVDDLGPHELKGVAERMRLFRVHQGTGARGRLQRATDPLATFVGRRHERDLLLERWERVRDGDGQLVVITGEAGIGKSRLVQVLRADVIARGDVHGWLECGASPFYQNTPFRPVIELLQQTLGVQADDGTDACDALAHRLGLAGVDPADAVPLLAPLLDLAVPPDRYPPLLLSPEQQRRRLFTLLATWVFAAAQRQPTVVVLEDLHWVDPSTLEFVDLLAVRGATVPLLLVCTARPEFRAPWTTRSHHLQIMLPRLDQRQARAMAAEVAGQRVLPSALVDTVAARTDGVPLFIEELTKSLLESDAVVTVMEAIPATLQDSLMARLDRLGEAKAIAQTAAVLGREFSYALLRAVTAADDAELDRALDRLVDAELIYAHGFRPDARYVFKHALVQSAAYESLLKKRRRELHASAAAALRQRFPEIADGQPELLAHHYSEAHQPEPAAAAWQRAAERAIARGAHGEATSHYERALAMLALLPESTALTQQQLIVQLALVQVLWYVKGWSSAESQAATARAREFADRLGDPAQSYYVLLNVAVVALVGGEMAVAEELAQQLIVLAERADDAAMRVWAYFSRGAVWYHRGKLMLAERDFEQALALYEEGQSTPLFADSSVPSHSYASLVACHLGFPDRARAESDAAIAIARRLGRPIDIAFALQVSAFLYVTLRDPVRVAAAAGELGTIAAEHGFPMQGALATIFDAWARAETGTLSDGAGGVRSALHQLALGKNLISRGFNIGMLAEIEARLGALRDALQTSEDALGAAPEDAVYRPDLLRVRADLLVRNGAGLDVVEPVLRESIAVAREQGARFLELRAATRLGELLAAAGRREEATALVVPVYEQLGEGFDLPDVRAAQQLLGTAPAARSIA